MSHFCNVISSEWMDMFYFVIVWRSFKAVSFSWRLKVSHYDIKPSSGAKFPTSFPSNSVKIWKTEHMILHLMVWPLSSVLFCYDRLVQLTDKKPEKTADIGDATTGFHRQMTSEKRAQKFHTDDASLPRSGYCFWLVESNFPRSTTNQTHYPDLGSDASSVLNFCARFSDVIWWGNQL